MNQPPRQQSQGFLRRLWALAGTHQVVGGLVLATILALFGWAAKEMATGSTPKGSQSAAPLVGASAPESHASSSAENSSGQPSLYSADFTASKETPENCSGNPVWEFVAFGPSGPLVDTGDSAGSDLTFSCAGNSDINGPYLASEWGKISAYPASNPNEVACLADANANPVDKIFYRNFQASTWVCYVSQDGGTVAALHLVTSLSDAVKMGVVKFNVTVWPNGM